MSRELLLALPLEEARDVLDVFEFALERVIFSARDVSQRVQVLGIDVVFLPVVDEQGQENNDGYDDSPDTSYAAAIEKIK